MAKTNWQDPKSSEIISPHISGLQEAIGKLEESLGISATAGTNIPLSEVYISESDRYRIFQAPEGQRNWLSSPAPVIKKNGVIITTGFVIEYGGGAIVFTTPLLSTDIVTADATYTVKEATSLVAQINNFAPHPTKLVTDVDGVHGLKMENGMWTPTIIGETTQPTVTYTVQRGTYLRIGKLIICSFFIQATLANGSGNIRIDGLPVVVKNIDESGIVSRASLGGTALNYASLFNAGSNSSGVRVFKDTLSYAQMSEINTGGVLAIAGSITYQIA